MITAIACVTLVLVGIRKLRERSWGKCENTVQLNEKVAIVTGANSGIGYEIAKELASRNAQVIVACRSLDSAQDAVRRLSQQINNVKLIPKELNLSSLKSVKDFADEIIAQYPEVHLLINNAGVSYPKSKPKETEDGLEIHFGVNYLSHFYLTNLLLDKMTKSPSRIVLVSSSMHSSSKIVLDDLSSKSVTRNLYADSKLAQIYFARELAKKTRENSKLGVFAVSPGWVYTNFFRHSLSWYHFILIAPVAFFFMRSARQGAQTAIYCATEPGLEQKSGMVFRDCKEFKSKLELSDEVGAKLWKASNEIIKSIMK